MEPDVCDKDIKIQIGVVVAKREPHPLSDPVDAHFVGNLSEGDVISGGVVSIDLEGVAVVGYPEIRVSVVVIVEEERCPGLSDRVADTIPVSVCEPGIIPFKPLSRDWMPELDWQPVGRSHGDLRTSHS